MRIGINIGPNGDWHDLLTMAQEAERLGFDSIGTLDHYHTEKLEWSYICGWSMYGALAMATSRIRLVPMVLDRMNYLPGVLAKEVAVLSLLSQGRFELGIGAGDFFEELQAWGLPLPDASTRITGLRETIHVVRNIWKGEFVTFEGQQLHLHNAASTPVPYASPRVIVGAGNSRRLISDAVAYTDELNVYADDATIRFALDTIKTTQRNIPLSVFIWDWSENIDEKMHEWNTLGIERVFLTIWSIEKLNEATRFARAT